MPWRLSRFVHLIPITESRILIVDAIGHVRQVVDGEVANIIRGFEHPTETPPAGALPLISALVQRGILTDKTPEEELAYVANLLGPFHGRDPAALLRRFRREAQQGGNPYYAVSKSLGRGDLEAVGRRVELILFGLCDMHMEVDFLRREAAARGLDLRVAATTPDDLRFAGEHRHDAIIIGLLEARATIAEDVKPGTVPHDTFIGATRRLLQELRELTDAPILIDGLPEPTVQPLGFAERGALGHRNRFRIANLALEDLAAEFSDVYRIDVAAALAVAGTDRMLDDGQFGYTHLGSPGWLLQRDESDKSALHGLIPDLAPLMQVVNGDPYGREQVMARAHIDALSVVLGLGSKKCVIVDLDGVLWPGVLAETGSPFALRPEVSPFSFTGLFFGVHEALLSLKKRGILLACVSKNDEAVVRELWKYEDHYPQHVLLKPEDFATWRVNWSDKSENIASIADELGLALDCILFIDDNPIERELVHQRLPEVEVWGEDLLGLRRRLLDCPALQQPRLTREAAARSELTKAQFSRRSAHAHSVSEAEFLESLGLQVDIKELAPDADMERVVELFRRTTQFNSTGVTFSVAELRQMARTGGRVYVAFVKDRFGDHGLVGAAALRRNEIVNFALSCRVLGLGVEHRFLQHLVAKHGHLTGHIIDTARNAPVRNLYRDNGFAKDEGGRWTL